MLAPWCPGGTAKAAAVLPPPPEPDSSIPLAGRSLLSLLRREASVLSTSYSTGLDSPLWVQVAADTGISEKMNTGLEAALFCKSDFKMYQERLFNEIPDTGFI